MVMTMTMVNMGKISIKSLVEEVGDVFKKDLSIYDKARKGSLPTKDFAMACLAVFYFKWPSLLTYEE